VTSNGAQVVASVLLAILLAWATWLSSAASDEWQTASKETVKWSAGLLETIRFVYSDEAPTAFDLARLDVRAHVLAARQTPVGSPIAVEAATAGKASGELKRAASTNALVADAYRLPEVGYDIQRRLGDALDVANLDPSVPATHRAEGDRRFAESLSLAWSTLAVLLGFVVVRVVILRHRRRAAQQAVDVELIPDPWTASSNNRLPNAIALFAWATAVVFAALQLTVSGVAARDGADALTRATEVSTIALGGQLFSSMQISAVRGPAVDSVAALSRQFVTVSLDDSAQQQLGEAEEAASTEWQAVAARMSRDPRPEDGLDAVTRRVITSGPDEWQAALHLQQAAADQAAREGDAANACGLALLLSVLGATSASIARVATRQRRLIAGVSGVFLLAAVAIAATAATQALR
jgi:hypothetical protein